MREVLKPASQSLTCKGTTTLVVAVQDYKAVPSSTHFHENLTSANSAEPAVSGSVGLSYACTIMSATAQRDAQRLFVQAAATDDAQAEACLAGRGPGGRAAACLYEHCWLGET